MATPKIEIFTTDVPSNAHDVQYKGFIVVNKVHVSSSLNYGILNET